MGLTANIVAGESAVGLVVTGVLLVALLVGSIVSRRWSVREKVHREELRDYIDLTAAMVIVVGVDGVLRDVNRRTCDILGYRRQELLGIHWIDRMVAPAERAASQALLAARPEPDSGSGLRRRTLLAKDGTEVLVEWEFAVRRDQHGDPIEYLASGHDITALEAHADQLRGLRSLAQAVAASDDARQDVVEHSVEITGAIWAAILEDGEVTAAAPMPAPELDLALASGSHRYEPIPIDGLTDAVLALGFDGPADEADEDLIGLLAGEAAVALRRIRAVQSLEEAALRDPLTDIANRRAFDIEMPRALARARRSGKPLALASLDLNDFKPLNDTEGHEAGDLMLRACADAWLTELRGTDLLARIGGDEFCVILPDCGAEHLPLVRRRLREACPHVPGAGVGIAIWDGTEAVESLQRRSDAALYADKRTPRGRALDDPARLAAVKATGLLDGKPDEILNELARAARWLLDIPTVAVSVISDTEQVLSAACGLNDAVGDAPRVPMVYSTCQHAIVSGKPLVTADARENELLRETPAVLELETVAYAGLPLFSPDGLPIGTLCAVSDQPRAWSEEDLATLQQLAVRAEAELARRSVRSVT